MCAASCGLFDPLLANRKKRHISKHIYSNTVIVQGSLK
jgi:hypothetical protein